MLIFYILFFRFDIPHSPIVIYLFFRYKVVNHIQMTTDRQKLFVRMMTPLFQAQQSVADLFFKNRLDKDIECAVEKHIQYQVSLSEESRREYIRVLKDLDKILEEIIYLKKGDTIQFAVAQEEVLQYLYGFLKEIRVTKQVSTETKVVVKSIEPIPHSVHQPTDLLNNDTSSVRKTIRHKGRLTETQKNILEFVRREPDCRTKDVIDQFSDLSQRTIKRGLKELNEEGKIIKRSDGGAVYYSAV